MKLEIKHIAPYLPYNLLSVSFRNRLQLNKIVVASNIMTFLDGSTNSKIVLRPLSDLTKEITVNGETFVPIDKLYSIEVSYSLDFYNNHTERLPYFIIKQLLQWHFDIFGLIENGLAIDINTLE